MRSVNQRGFTLIELIVALVVFGIVSGGIYGLLTRTQRLSRTQAERSVMQANIRTGIALVTSELRELNVDTANGIADIYSMSSTAIEYKGMRATGFICEVADDRIKVLRGGWLGYRDPDYNRDALMLFVENDPNKAADDGWTERAISSTSASTCTVAGVTVQAWRLDFGSNLLSPDTLAMITIGSPVRTCERMEIGQVVAGGETWLGARSVSGGEATLQPVIGPLIAAPNGVRFTYWTGEADTSTETTAPLQVRTIRLVLRGVTENIVAAGAGTVAWQRASDTLITDIRLRNAP